MRKFQNIIPLITVLIIGLTVVGVIKCDADRLDKHLNKCRQICNPNEIIEILSKKKCVCKEEIPEQDIIPTE